MNTTPNNKNLMHRIAKKIASITAIAALTVSTFNAQAQNICTDLVSVHSFDNVATNQNNIATFSGATSYVNGVAGQAITSSATARTATINGLPTGNSVRTISIWFLNTTTGSGYTNIFHYGSDANTERFGAYYNIASGELYFQGFGSGNDELINNATITANTWHHLVVAYTGANVQVFLDGVLKETFARTLNTGTVLPFTIGGSGFSGYFDDLRVYNRVLTASDVTSLYSNSEYDCFGVIGNKCTDLVSSYFFNGTEFNQDNAEGFSNIGAYGTGVAGQAMASSAVQNTATITTLPTGNNPRTISLWFKDIGSTGYVNIFNYGNNAAAQRFGAYHNTTTGELYFQGFGTGNDEVINGVSIAQNTWYHLVITYTGSTVEVFLNGVLKESFSKNLNTGTSLPFSVGGFTGYFDDLKIYDARLGAADVLYLYNNPEDTCTASNATELFHYPFDGQSLISSINSSDVLSVNQGTTQFSTATSTGGGTHALSTDGNQYFSAPFTMPVTTGFTISMWVNRPTASNNYDILAAHLERINTSFPGTFSTGLNPSGNPFMEVYSSSFAANTITSTYTLQNASWQHLTFQWKSTGKAYIYVNGIVMDSINCTTVLNPNATANFNIGSMPNTISGVPGLQSSYEGHIDEVRFFDGALTPAEVFDLYSHVTSVYNLDNKEIVAHFFPNPASSILNILLNRQGETTIEIYDLTGKQVKSTMTADAQTQINVEDLNAGIYLVKITNGTASQTAKFVKE